MTNYTRFATLLDSQSHLVRPRRNSRHRPHLLLSGRHKDTQLQRTLVKKTSTNATLHDTRQERIKEYDGVAVNAITNASNCVVCQRTSEEAHGCMAWHQPGREGGWRTKSAPLGSLSITPIICRSTCSARSKKSSTGTVGTAVSCTRASQDSKSRRACTSASVVRDLAMLDAFSGVMLAALSGTHQQSGKSAWLARSHTTRRKYDDTHDTEEARWQTRHGGS